MNTHSESVLIVGGGIIGLACAHYLSDAGFKVTVIDRGAIGAECSFANCGYVCPSHILPLNSMGTLKKGLKSLFQPRAPFRFKPQWRSGLYRWFWEFARRAGHRAMIDAGHQLAPLLESSLHEYRQLMATGALDAEWQESGLLYVFLTEAGLDDYAGVDQLLSGEYGESARRLDSNDLTALEPALRDGLAGAYLYQSDGFLRPDKLIRAWQQLLTENGVTFLPDTPMTGVRRQGDRIVAIETPAADRTADHYVFATGAWSAKLAKLIGCHLPIEPGKGYSVTMKKPPICPSLPMLFPEHGIGVTTFETGFRLGSMMEFVGFDNTIPAHRIRQLKDAASHYLAEPVGAGDGDTWFGWRPMTWDSLPVIGRVPGTGNALLATGHNMLGLTLAPVTGLLVCELLSGQSTHLNVDAFSPARFSM